MKALVEEQAKARELRAKGLTLAAIAAALGKQQNVIHRWVNPSVRERYNKEQARRRARQKEAAE